MAKPVKRALRVVLMADDFVVAETEDPALWRSVLDAIHRSPAGGAAAGLPAALPSVSNSPEPTSQKPERSNSGPDSVTKFADAIGVSIAQLQGACRPSTSQPFLRLDHHHWEAMKKQTPVRGPQAVSPIVVASTLLVLWLNEIDGPRATIEVAQQVLATIGARDKNPSRALKNCAWLQTESRQINLNPAETSRAYSLARKYCEKQWKEESPSSTS